MWYSPGDAVASAVYENWCSVLEVDAADVHDNFFEMGGDSLMAVRLVEGIESRLRIRLSLESLFFDASLEALLRHSAEAADRPGGQSGGDLAERHP